MNTPTHVAGNTLDQVITSIDLNVNDIFTDRSVKSDHYAVIFSITSASPGAPKQSITYRKWSSVDVDLVRTDIAAAFNDFDIHCKNLDAAVKHYNSLLCDIAAKHAPEKSRVVCVRAESPWFTSELAREKRDRRKLERAYKRTNLESDELRLIAQRDKYNHLLSEAKKNYYKSQIENTKSPKEQFKVCNKLLNRGKKIYLTIT